MNSPKKIERLPDPVPGEVVPLKEMVWKTNEIIDAVNEMKLEMDIAEKAYAKLHHKVYTSEGDAVGEVEISKGSVEWLRRIFFVCGISATDGQLRLLSKYLDEPKSQTK